ncbi:HD domain-containing protein 2 [Entomortierella beljakovae]|nr:HD domain-containing protein 2 [Entomortierella beljakovae]
MDSFSTDTIGSPLEPHTIVVKLQYKGAVYDSSIRVLPQTHINDLYLAAKNIANIPENAVVSLLRLDNNGEYVSNSRDLHNGELLEIIEGSPENLNVSSRISELQPKAENSVSPDRRSPVQSVKGTLQFLHTVEKLKRTKRTGWVNNDVKPAESIADHMYRMSIMALLIDEKTAGVDKNRCIKMAIVHDLAESLVGDITPYDGVTNEDKHTREKNAMHYLCHDLLGWTEQAKEINALWHEYEAALTPEALLVKDFDKFEMIVQALEYERSEGKTLESFFAGTRGKFKHPMVTAWVSELEAERAELQVAKQ